MKLKYDNALISKKDLNSIEKKLKLELGSLKTASKIGYADLRASINLPADKKALKEVQKVVKEKLKLKPAYLVVCGIGGSNLGTIAIQEAVLGKNYNLMNPKTKVLYADTVDADSMHPTLVLMNNALKKGEQVIINGVSKSGGTTETITNFEILVQLLKKHRKNYSKYIVVTTDKNSKFWNYAQDKGFSTLEVPKMVGGRFSVLSPVGLFPLGVLGVKIDKLLKGANAMQKQCLNNFNKNPAALSAAIQYYHYQKGKNISDLFLFSNDLESLGRWYRQLMGESLGKDKKGMTPTISIGSTDLHSVGQLYLGGPNDKLTTFVTAKTKHELKAQGNSKLVEGIKGKKMGQLMKAIIQGVKIAYRKRKVPFIEIGLKDKSEKAIGEFLQFKMIEIMFLGELLGVNAFNQPNVESYKAETKKLLNKSL